jgi:hypothetical protein
MLLASFQKGISMMSTKFRPSDLVPAGFIAERITHIDDETCILLSRAGATAACPACGRMPFIPIISDRSNPLEVRFYDIERLWESLETIIACETNLVCF